MKNIIKVFIIIIAVLVIIASPLWFNSKSLKVRNVTLTAYNGKAVKATTSEFKISEVNKPDISSVRGIFYDPYDDSLNYLHLDINQKNWFLSIASPGGNITKTVNLGNRNVNK